jgi:mono/diheme cytochrome c family protein
MLKKTQFCYLFLLAMPIAAQAPQTLNQPVPITKISITSSGKQMYETYCAVCHGSTGIGNGPAATALKSTPANLTKLSANNKNVFPTEHVAAVLRFGVSNPAHGTPGMPIWSDLFSLNNSPDETNLRIRKITDYIKTMQGK